MKHYPQFFIRQKLWKLTASDRYGYLYFSHRLLGEKNTGTNANWIVGNKNRHDDSFERNKWSLTWDFLKTRTDQTKATRGNTSACTDNVSSVPVWKAPLRAGGQVAVYQNRSAAARGQPAGNKHKWLVAGPNWCAPARRLVLREVSHKGNERLHVAACNSYPILMGDPLLKRRFQNHLIQ